MSSFWIQLLIVGAGGLLGLVLGTAVVAAIGSMPLLGPIQEHTGDQGNIQLQLSLPAVLVLSITPSESRISACKKPFWS